MSKLEKLKQKFYFDEKGQILELGYYGDYKMGLTEDEIKDYLRVRANTVRIETLYKKFCKIAGNNTMGIYKCPCCNFETSLMYRHDVQRFADKLFLGKETYFD